MKRILKAAFIVLAASVICICLSSGALGAKESSSIKLTAKNLAQGISLSWNADSSASLYGVYRTQGKNKTLLARVSKTSYTDKAVKNAESYTYSVVALNKKGKTLSKSNDDSITRLSRPAFTSYSNTVSGIKLSWTKSEGATFYRIYRRTGSSKKWKHVAKISAGSLSYTDKKVSPDSSYTYIIKGYTSDSVSCTSSRLKADFTKSPEITKILSNKKSLSVYWQKDPKAVSYEIYRTDADSAKLRLYKTVKADTTKLTDSNVTLNKKYGYAIRSVNKSGKKSALPSAVYCVLMKAPQITSVQNASDGVKLKWKKSSSASSYNIYRRTADSDAWKKIGSTKSLSLTDKSVSNGKKYFYTVRAVYNKTQSTYNKEGVSICFVSAPTKVSVKFVSKTSSKITWAGNKSATSYNVYRRHEDSTEWTKLASTAKTSYTDKKVKKGEIYYYFVRAYINKNRSAASTFVRSSTVNPDGKLVALTYDDGPSNVITPRILDTLEKYSARATFFVLGSRIDECYKPMQRAVKLGCEIGNHTYGHINLPSNKKKKIVSEISKTNKLVEKYTGVTPVLARAPGGSTDSASRKTVNMPFIYWSIDTRDWETMNTKAIVAHVKNEVRDGSIILMHDVYDATAEATEIIVPWLIKQGYQLVTVSELMQAINIKLQKGVTYYNAYK